MAALLSTTHPPPGLSEAGGPTASHLPTLPHPRGWQLARWLAGLASAGGPARAAGVVVVVQPGLAGRHMGRTGQAQPGRQAARKGRPPWARPDDASTCSGGGWRARPSSSPLLTWLPLPRAWHAPQPSARPISQDPQRLLPTEPPPTRPTTAHPLLSYTVSRRAQSRAAASQPPPRTAADDDDDNDDDAGARHPRISSPALLAPHVGPRPLLAAHRLPAQLADSTLRERRCRATR